MITVIDEEIARQLRRTDAARLANWLENELDLEDEELQIAYVLDRDWLRRELAARLIANIERDEPEEAEIELVE